MQPVHQTWDRMMAEARSGQPRLDGAYAWRAILQSGARLAFGSDFPVESPDPSPAWRPLQPAGPPGPAPRRLARRRSGNPRAGPGWLHPRRGLCRFAEDRIGSLEPGKWADFILVDRDPTKVDPQALAKTQVLQTWVAGEKVSRARG